MSKSSGAYAWHKSGACIVCKRQVGIFLQSASNVLKELPGNQKKKLENRDQPKSVAYPPEVYEFFGIVADCGKKKKVRSRYVL